MLIGIMSLDFLFNSVEFVGKSLPSVLVFHGKHTLQGFLLASQDLNFFLVSVKLFLKLSDGFSQA